MRPAIKHVPKPCIMPTRALPKSRRDLGDLLLDKSAEALEPQAARALFAYFRKEFGP